MHGNATVAILPSFDFLSEQLRALFVGRFREDCGSELFDYPNVLSTAAARIELAHSLGWLAKPIKEDLEKIRKLRNDCAHTFTPLKWEDEPLRSHIKRSRRVEEAWVVNGEVREL